MPSGSDQGPDPITSSFASDPDMADLVALFIQELPTRIQSLRAAWESERLSDLQRLAHQLKGTGIGYGFPAITRAAGSLENRLMNLGEDTDTAAAASLTNEYQDLIDVCQRASGKDGRNAGRTGGKGKQPRGG